MSGQRSPDCGLINRLRPMRFRFDGTEYSGFEGDTLASALLGSGVEVVGRSFKYHRPRGLLAAGVEEPNALVQVGAGAHMQLNLRATEVARRVIDAHSRPGGRAGRQELGQLAELAGRPRKASG